MRKAEFIQAVARGVAQRSDIDAFLNEQGFGPGDDSEEEAKEQTIRVQRIAQLATFLADEVAKHAPFEDDMPPLFGLGLKGPDVASLLLQFANAIEDLKGRVDQLEILPLGDCKKCGLRLSTAAGRCSGCGEPR